MNVRFAFGTIGRMTKTGILVHVYHLDTTAWEAMVWGRPEQDELGSVTKLVECLLDMPADEQVSAIIYSGPSQKDGLTEGGYMKQYLLDRFDRLQEFPRLRKRLEQAPEDVRNLLLERIQAIALGPELRNTADEVQFAAKYFRDEQVDRVFQVAAATHAPRCLREQVSARYHGLIDKNQKWYVVASDVNYEGISPDDVIIAEPIHRQDNPLYGFRPAWAEVAKMYPRLSTGNKKELLRRMDANMQELLANQPASTEVRN